MYFYCICGKEGDLRVLLFRHLPSHPSAMWFLLAIWRMPKGGQHSTSFTDSLKKKTSVYYVLAQQNLQKILRRLKVCCHAAIFHLSNASDSFAALPRVPESMRTSTGDPRSEGGFHPQKKANWRLLMTIHPPLLLHSLVTWP